MAIEDLCTQDLRTVKIKLCSKVEGKKIFGNMGEFECIKFIPLSSFIVVTAIEPAPFGSIIIRNSDGVYKYSYFELPEDDIYKKAMNLFDRPGLDMEYVAEEEPEDIDTYLLIGLISLYSDLYIDQWDMSETLKQFDRPDLFPLYLASISGLNTLSIPKLGLVTFDR